MQTQVDDPFGRPIDIVKSRAVREGADLHTTLDHTIQAQAEQVLRQTVTEWHAKDASAIVLDPRTGAVLAMAQAPGYNANETNKVSLPLQRNRSVTDTFEPGSTFKLVTISAAISSGIVSPSTRFRLPYSIRVADRVIHDAEPRPTEWMTVSQILARSSNVGAITIASSRALVRRAAWARSLHEALRPAVQGAGDGWLVAVAMASAVGEELLFRGLLVPVLGILASSALFGALHQVRGPARWGWIAWATVMGLLFGLLFAATGSLAGPLAAHVAINAANLRFLRDTDPAPRRRALGGLLRRT